MARIWIINQYASTPQTGIAGRHHYFAKNLAMRGHQVSLIAADWHHLLNVQTNAKLPKTEHLEGYEFVRLSTLRYSHAHDLRRVISWFIFSRKIAHLPKRLGSVPDVILYSSPSLIGWIGAHKLAKKHNARLVFEVRDIWPMTLTEIGNISKRNPVILYMQYLERRAYVQSNAVVSNLPGAGKRLEELGISRDKFSWIPNGISLDEVSNPDPISDDLKKVFSKEHFVAGYAGSLGEANALDVIIDAAHYLRDNELISFVLVGDGRRKSEIEKRIQARGLRNVLLCDNVPKAQVQSLLANFDICLVNWKNKEIYRFGTSANKMFDYLYSGKPIVNGYSGFHDYVSLSNAGLTVPADNARAFADAIAKLASLPDSQRATLGLNGKRAAIADFDYAKLTDKLEAILLL